MMPRSAAQPDRRASGPQSAGPAPPPAQLPIPLPPGIPPGVNPLTYQQDKVAKLLKSAAYFPIFNVANPAMPNKPLLLVSDVEFLLIGVEVNEELHRFEVRVTEQGGALRASKRVGEPVSNVHIRWT